ncbi:hypothetical protein GBA52_009892 [Prunus armeniaca]|nr:hypothetical protein GBA52_009892 [Prunus armeniaca]
MSEDVWLTCLTHALSTETEEIMGLLLGDIENSVNGGVTALIWGASPQTRSDRRKDRVETNPEQMTTSTGRTTRVIGWYHSHPHITVLPSHVDVRTQAMYQLLDSGFIGLIFSCFSEDINKVGRIQVIAFQSSDGKQHHMSRPISLSPVNKSPVIEVESSLSTSENEPARSFRAECPEQDTADSRTSGTIKGGGRSSDLGLLFANADANHLEKERIGGNHHTNTSDIIIADIDHMDMSESMQEAMHRSNLDMSGAEYVRKEVPLHVLPTSSLIKLDSPLLSFTELQRVLYEEERAAYNQAISQNMRDGKVHPLTYIHHTSMYQASMCKLIEYCLSPAINALQCRLRENEIRSIFLMLTIFMDGWPLLKQLAMLTEEVKNLETETHRASEQSSGSPRQVPSPRQISSPRQVSSPVPRGSTPLGHRDLFSPTESISARGLAGSGSRSRKGS